MVGSAVFGTQKIAVPWKHQTLQYVDCLGSGHLSSNIIHQRLNMCPPIIAVREGKATKFTQGLVRHYLFMENGDNTDRKNNRKNTQIVYRCACCRSGGGPWQMLWVVSAVSTGTSDSLLEIWSWAMHTPHWTQREWLPDITTLLCKAFKDITLTHFSSDTLRHSLWQETNNPSLFTMKFKMHLQSFPPLHILFSFLSVTHVSGADVKEHHWCSFGGREDMQVL